MKIILFINLLIKLYDQPEHTYPIYSKQSCTEDEEICLIEIDEILETARLKKETEITSNITAYEECFSNGHDGCEGYLYEETLWYIDENYTQWKIENGSRRYLDTKKFKWINS